MVGCVFTGRATTLFLGAMARAELIADNAADPSAARPVISRDTVASTIWSGCLTRSGFTLDDLVLRATKVRAEHIDTHLLLSVVISRTPVLGESSENVDTTKTDGDLVVSELLDRLGIAIVQLRDLFRALLVPPPVRGSFEPHLLRLRCF